MTKNHNKKAPIAKENTVPRVSILPKAEELLGVIKDKHGAVIFHQSGGCCDGSAPMCYPWGDMKLAEQDVYMGEVTGTPVFIGARQFELWKHTHLILDAVEGRGAGFSLEAPEGMRFIIRSRLFSKDEQKTLETMNSPQTADQLEWL